MPMGFSPPLAGNSDALPTSMPFNLLRLLLGATAVALLCVTVPHLAQAESLAIVVNDKNPLVSLRPIDLASMYRGEELHWPHGGRIKLVNRETASLERAQFYRQVLNAKPDQRFYVLNTPIAVQSLIRRSDEAVLRFVAAIEGAIGYVRLSQVNPSVKVVLIIDAPSTQ
jgi:ABC-type phosphate transport system substrate-binding protein